MARDAKSTFLREQRDLAIFRAYTKALAEHHFSCDTEACNWVRKQPAPSFFTSPEFCQIIVSRLLRGKDSNLKGARRAKFEELKRLYLERVDLPRFKGKPMIDICNEIVYLPAPEFYLERRIVAAIIQEQKKKHMQKVVDRWVR